MQHSFASESIDSAITVPTDALLTRTNVVVSDYLIQAARRGKKPSADDIQPEVAVPLVHAMLDKQYRTTLDEPVGMRAAVSRHALQLGPIPHDPTVTYDFFSWL